MKKILAENQFGHGAKRAPVRSFFKRLSREKVGASEVPFDWATGIDIANRIHGTITIKNQYTADSCGGEAGSYFIAAVTSFLEGTPYVDQSAKSVYAPIYYPGGGTTVGSLEKQVCTGGSLDESLVPSYRQSGTTDEVWMEDRSWMTPANLKLAMQKAGWTALSVKRDIESIAEAIRDYGGVIWEITAQNNGTWLTSHPNPPINNQGLWNHFMFIGKAFLENGAKTLGGYQSWGATVGDGGKQYFKENYINSGYIDDVFTFYKTPTEPSLPEPVETSITYKDTSTAVLSLQKALNMPTNLQTSYFGILTLGYVMLYQYRNGLQMSTTVTPQMRQMLGI